jgi:hypothetical protein
MSSKWQNKTNRVLNSLFNSITGNAKHLPRGA